MSKRLFRRAGPWLILLIAVLFPALNLWPEVNAPIDLADTLVHQALVDAVLDEWAAGRSGLDPWIPDWTFGHPVLHHYQPAAYWLSALAVKLSPLPLSTNQHVDLLTWLLWSLHPLVWFVSLRWLGIGRWSAACGALLSPLVSSPGLYGWEQSAFVWSGRGLYAQLVAAWPFPLALAAGYRAVLPGGRVWPAGLLLALTTLCHLMWGYMIAVGWLLLLLPRSLPGEDQSRSFFRRRGFRLGRLLQAYAGTALLTAFFVIPFLLDRDFVLHSRWEPAWKWESFGLSYALNTLFSGDLLDAGSVQFGSLAVMRPPILSLLALLGGILAIGRRSRFGYLVAFCGLWYLVFFGSNTWGPLLRLLPFAGDLHLHRVVGSVQMVAPVVAASGLVWIFRSLHGPDRTLRNRLPALVRWGLSVLVVCCLVMAALERWQEERKALPWMEQTRAAVRAADPLMPFLASLDPERDGRIYAGRNRDYGDDFKLGMVPAYAALQSLRFPALSYLYMAMAPPSDVLVYFDWKRLDHCELFGVRTLLVPEDEDPPPFARFRARGPGWQLFDLPTSAWFSLVDRAGTLVTESEDARFLAMRQWLSGPGPRHGRVFGLERRRIVELEHSADLPEGPEGSRWTSLASPPDQTPLFDPCAHLRIPSAPRGEIMSVAVEGSRWRAEVRVERSCHLLLKSTYHPNLRADVDGEATSVEEVSPHFAAVPLAPGTHQVEIRYQSRWWRAWLAALGGVAFALCALWEERRGVSTC